MNTTTRPPRPRIDYEWYDLMLGSGYHFHVVYDETENRYFVKLTRKVDRKD